MYGASRVKELDHHYGMLESRNYPDTNARIAIASGQFTVNLDAKSFQRAGELSGNASCIQVVGAESIKSIEEVHWLI